MPRKVAGHGIGLRRPYYDEVLHTSRRVDWMEITPENWLRRGGERARQLAAAAERFALVPHSVSLSIGGPDPLEDSFLDEINALCKLTDPPFWSDHLCYSSAHGIHFHDLLPLPFTREAVRHTVQRIEQVKRRVDRPFLLENATFYAFMPGAEMDEATFMTEILEQADCGMLLDVNNVYVNSVNHGFDALRFIDALPLKRVAYVHMAGHTKKQDVIIDTHIGPIIEPVWQLYAEVMKRLGPVPVMVEWDDEIPGLDAVLDEADRAREITTRVCA
ncbi:MAG: DUF692 domain-containing protein [Myxococcota bacterium]